MITTIPGAIVTLIAMTVAVGVIFGSMHQMITSNARDANRWRMIDRLRNAGTVVCITIVQPNDDPENMDDQEGVIISADWTDYQDRFFGGATIDVALARAVYDMEQSQ
jgi:hypothetical protein